MIKYCILWPGFLDKDGYGQINSNREGTLRPPRIVLEEKLPRPIRKGHHAHHICYCVSCINPDHIEEKTPAGNNKDKFIPDRPKTNRVELKKEDVYLVKYLLAKGKDIKVISEFIKVTISTESGKDFVDMPHELIGFIRDSKVWDYIHLSNREKAEALIKLDSLLPINECIDADWGGNGNKYTKVQLNKKNNKPTHVFAYEIATVHPVPAGEIVRHSIMCNGNKRCLRPKHLSIGSQKANINDKILHGTIHRDRTLDNLEERIVNLHDKDGLSFREIGRVLGKELRKGKNYDHKTIKSRYDRYKVVHGDKLPEKQKTQKELLYENEKLLLNMKDELNYSYRQIALKLGEELRHGKSFDEKLVKDVYLCIKQERNELVIPSISELLLNYTDRIKSLVEKEKNTFTSIAVLLTKELKLKKPLNRKQIKKVYEKSKL